MLQRSVLPLVVLLPVVLGALAGCSAAAPAGGQTPDAAAGLDCDAVATSFESQAKSEGVDWTYAKVDPSTIIGVQDLPAEALGTGCFVSSNQKVAHVLIPVSDSTNYDALAATLIANGYELDDSQNIEENAHTFYNSDKSVPQSEYLVEAFDGMTRGHLGPNHLPKDLFDEDDGPMLYVVAGIR